MERLFLLLTVLACVGCRPEIDVLAPEKELYVIWGVLNPLEKEQFIKVSKVFQTDSDAVIYASENDLSAEGFEVVLKGNGKSLLAEEVVAEREGGGTFTDTHLLYKINTAGGDALSPGERYTLEIRKPDNNDFLISAYTDVPTSPYLRNPSPPIYSIEQYNYTMPTLDFTDDYVVYFRKGSGKGFELRVFVEYEEGGEIKTARWGPTPVFTQNRGCGANNQQGEMCYEIGERVVPNGLRSTFSNLSQFTIDDSVNISPYLDSLSKAVRLEVTAVDTFLTAYLYANVPFGYGLNLLMDKPEISNISGDHIGVFGSIHPHHRYIRLGACAKYFAGILPSAPSFCD